MGMLHLKLASILVEDLDKYSVFVPRQVYAGICHTGGVLKVGIKKSLIKSMHMLHAMY